MMRQKVQFILVALTLSGMRLSGQTDDFAKQNIIEQRLEVIVGALDESADFDYTDLLDDLTYYYEHPLNLNDATATELQTLYLLTDTQIRNLLNHRVRYGSMKRIFELQAVEGFDMETIRLIRPFVTVREPGALKGLKFSEIVKGGSNDLFLRYRRTVEKQGGYIPDPETGRPDFAGSPNYVYMRYRFKFRRNISAGFTMEKDAGETLEKGPDYSSAHLFYRDNGFVRALAIGDYQAQFGQGLTMWNGLGFGKSAYVLNVKKNPAGLRPYTSVNESLFMRGLATTLGYKGLELTAMYSRKNLSGNLIQANDSLIVDDNIFVSSISSSGLHRTESEIENKNTVQEEIAGGNLNFRKGAFSAGVTATQVSYSKPMEEEDGLYQQFRFAGKRLLNIGADYQAVIRNVNVFGEIARSDNGGLAVTNGVVASVHSRIAVSAVHRYFTKDYQVIYANAFAEGNQLSPSNEKGVFLGVQASLGKGWTLSAYSDQVSFPWLKFKTNAPTNFSDHFAQLNYKPDRTHEFIIRYRVRRSHENGAPEDARMDYLVDRKIQNIRLNAIFKAHENVQLRSRAEWTVFTKEGKDRETGFLIYQDVIWKKMGFPVSLAVRYALFSTGSYETRIYAYETDVLYSFSIPAHSGQGSRVYAMAKIDITRGVDLWLRWSQWYYTDREVISSGTGEIQSNRRNDLTAQLRWQF